MGDKRRIVLCWAECQDRYGLDSVCDLEKGHEGEHVGLTSENIVYNPAPAPGGGPQEPEEAR